MSIRNWLICASVLAFPAAAHAEDGRVIGDSIGVGVSWAAKIPSTAKNSVSIYSGAIMEQLRQAQKGETVFMSLGTNDAVGGAIDVKAHVEQIVAEADKLGVKLVWIGPPCVLKPWEEYSKKLDGILASELSGTSATYVSMQGAEFCSTSLHAPEGVHFNMAGYTRMWQKAAAAAGFSTAVASAAAPVHVAQASEPRVRKHKRHRHRSHAQRQADTTETPKSEPVPQ
jgi:copper(I)-binding protein